MRFRRQPTGKQSCHGEETGWRDYRQGRGQVRIEGAGRPEIEQGCEDRSSLCADAVEVEGNDECQSGNRCIEGVERPQGQQGCQISGSICSDSKGKEKVNFVGGELAIRRSFAALHFPMTECSIGLNDLTVVTTAKP